MLVRKLCEDKTQRKNQTRYGVSVVHLPSNTIPIGCIREDVQDQLGILSNLFEWTPNESLHMTVLRGPSNTRLTYCSERLIALLTRSMGDYQRQTLHSHGISLEQNGVIRLMFGHLHTTRNRWLSSAEADSLWQAGYRVIGKPWITLAHLHKLGISEACRNGKMLTELIEQVRQSCSLDFDSLDVVEYNDTAFRYYCSKLRMVLI